MELEQVEKIRFCRQTIKGILAAIEPVNDDEWTTFETLTSVHRALRRIDLGNISQQRMNLVPKEPGEQIELPDPRATVVYGEDSLVEHPHLEVEHELEIERLADEGAKKKLVIRTPEPGSEDQQFHVIIGDSETVGFSLLATVAVALAEFGDRIPDCLSEKDQKILRGILETGALSPAPEEKPKPRRGRRPKVEV